MGMFALAAALFGMEHVYPRWKRWLLGLVGAALVLTFWIVKPQFPSRVDDDAGPDCDPSIPHRYGGC